MKRLPSAASMSLGISFLRGSWMVRAFIEATAGIIALMVVVIAYSERGEAVQRAESAESALQQREEQADMRLRATAAIATDLCRCAHGLMTSTSGKGVVGLGSEELERLVKESCLRR